MPVLPVNGWLGSPATSHAQTTSIQQPADDAVASANAAVAAAAANTAVAADSHLAKLYFELGSIDLKDVNEEIAPILATLSADKATTAHISGFHDASGNPDANDEIARQRADTVMGLLVSRGVEPDRIVLD
ncbi:MAG: OmpA family protein, partial [Pseudoxanthomonas sp.]